MQIAVCASAEDDFLSLIYFLSMYISLALYCIVPEGFQTSLKPEEALIYLYDGCMHGQDVLPWICTGYGKCMVPLNCYLRRQSGYRTVLEPPTSVQAF